MAKGKCEYLYIGGMRVPMDNVLVTVTGKDGTVNKYSVKPVSPGAGRGTPPIKTIAQLKSLPKNSSIVATIYDPQTGNEIGEPFAFDPSKAFGRAGRKRAAKGRSEEWEQFEDNEFVADLLAKGISYGNSKGVSSANVRQVEQILAQAGGADVLAGIIRTGASMPFVDKDDFYGYAVRPDSASAVRPDPASALDSAFLGLRGLCDLVSANPAAVQEHAALFLDVFGTSETGRLLETGATLGYIPTGTDALLGAVTSKHLKALLPLVTGDVLTRVASCAGEELALEAMLQSNDGSFEAVRAVIDAGLMFEDARKFLKLGGRIEELKEWRSQGFTPQMLASYVAAGFVTDADVSQLGVVSSGEGVLSAYNRAGWLRTPDESSSSYVVYPSGSAIDEYRSLGFSSADIATLVRARILPQMAKGFVKAGITDASVLATIPVVLKLRPAVSYRAGGMGYAFAFAAAFQPENVSAIHARAAKATVDTEARAAKATADAETAARIDAERQAMVRDALKRDGSSIPIKLSAETAARIDAERQATVRNALKRDGSSIPIKLSAEAAARIDAERQAMVRDAEARAAKATASRARGYYIIGDVGPAGGIIFAVESGMCLEAAPEDIGAFKWDKARAEATRYTTTRNGTRYNDWYLPSRDELYAMYENRKLIGGFSTDRYWSSSEADGLRAWYQNVNHGDRNFTNKYATYSVRPVRAFSI